MLIGEVAKLVKLPIETLRYYDKIGLLVPARKQGRRDYSQQDLKKLQDIIKMKQLLFTLEEIKTILAMDEKIEAQLIAGEADKAIAEMLAAVQKKYEAIIQLETDLQVVKARLAHIISKIDSINKGRSTPNGK